MYVYSKLAQLVDMLWCMLEEFMVNISSITRSCPNLLWAILSTIYSVLKNFQQFFFMWESNILSSSCVQFIVFCDDGPFRPTTCKS
jgi:hypothetical protein